MEKTTVKDLVRVGDIIKVTTRDPRSSKVHATPFEGVVISFRGEGENKTFTVRRVAQGNIAVERIFPFASPLIENIKVVKKGVKVRRAKLYYLRKKLNQ